MDVKGSSITKSRRKGVVRYIENPSVKEAYYDSKTGNRRIGNRTDKELAYITSPDGERLAEAQFYDYMTVDKTKFIKLYIQGVKALQGLSSAGTKVFELLYCEMQKKISSDKIYLHYSSIQTEGAMSLATFKRGMKELIEKQFIFESVEPFNYFVNVNYLFNGDRLSFVKSFELRK
jgi:hypothetical protein